jgi:multiple sugar transport system substrate-binding protein
MAPGALPGTAAPATWDEVLALARAHPGRVTLPLHPAHAISALLSLLAAADPDGWSAAFARPRTLRWATGVLAALAAAGAGDAYGWEPPEALARLAGGELVCVPLVYAYVGYAVQWAAAPARRPGGRPGSILGGVGVGVAASAGCADPPAAARLAVWLGSLVVAREIIAPAGGQPAARGAWSAPGADAMFAAVLPTLRSAEMRPRAAWWPECQRACGELLVDGLRAGADPDTLAAELSSVYHHHREVTA